DLYRILASQSSTSVTVNCSTLSEVLTYNLDTAGSWQEFTTPDKSFCSITSDKPLLVMQFALGNNEDGIGDPFMMMITPVEQYSNNYVFNVLPEFEINYITLYVTPEDFQPESIFVDDTNLENSTWVAVYYSSADICGYITSTSLLPGEHQLYHADVSSQIGVSAYGFNAFNSYGYPGGLQLEPVQLAIISFSQSEFTVLENEEFARVKLVRSGDISREAVVLIGSDPYKGDAAARSDYMPIIEILTFLPEELTKRVDVVINDDTNVEFDESFFLYLVSGEGVHLSPFQRAKVVIRNDDGKITLTPRYGSEIGGTPIIVTGDKITASAEDNVTCVFDGIETDGFVTKDGQVLCVSPEMRRTGRVPFKLHIEGEKNMFNGISIFRSVPHERAAGVSIETNPLITSGDMVRLRWSKEAILPTERHDRYTINVALGEYDENSAKWVYTELAKDMPNTGYIEIAVPERSPKADNDSGSPVVFQIGVSESSTETQIRKRGIFRNIIKNVIRGITFVTKVYILVKYPKTEVIRRAACELWGLAESREASLQILSELPPCPCTVSEINGNIFKQESIASVIFHPDSDKCFRQRMPSTTAGQQCCYDEDGDIIVGQDSGGTIDFVAPKDFKTTIGHFFVDVVPHIFCCTPLLLSKCEKYYEFRPSDDCSRTRPQRPAFARGRSSPGNTGWIAVHIQRSWRIHSY
ncbi:Sushi domain-containing protein 2, partial [Geodia barretti]